MSYTSPVMQLGDSYVGFAGEFNKWVPVSPQRFNGLDRNTDSVTISMSGVVGEVIAMRFLVQLKVGSCFLTDSCE